MALLGILLAALWLAGLALCLHLLLSHKPRTKKFKNFKPRSRPRRKSRQRAPLKNELAQLLNGDNRTAERLIKSTRRKHPNQSEQWCREKAIYDLERDRR